MKTLALDISSVATGWAVFKGNDLVATGVINPPKTNLSQAAKFYYISHSVAAIIKLYRPTSLAIEDTFYSKDPTVLKKLNRIAGQIQYLWFSFCGKDPYFYMASSARTSFEGLTGKSKKDEIVSAVNKFFKMRLKDHNIADAIVIGWHHVTKQINKGNQRAYKRTLLGGNVCVRPKRNNRRVK